MDMINLEWHGNSDFKELLTDFKYLEIKISWSLLSGSEM